MIEIKGKIARGKGNASSNFQQGKVEAVVAKMLGVSKSEIVHGTLNVEITREYEELDNGIYDDKLAKREYNGKECVKFKRCKVNGYPSVIIRPSDHFVVEKFKRRIEIMSNINFREYLNLSDESEVILQFQGDNSWWNENKLKQHSSDNRNTVQ